MRRKLFCTVALCLFVAAIPCIADNAEATKGEHTEIENHSSDRAEKILQKSPRKRSDEERRVAISWLEAKLKEKPKDTEKLRMKMGLELALSQYEKALSTTETLVKHTDSVSPHLFSCVLRERLNKNIEGCYKQIVSDFELKGDPGTDFNYLFALRMAHPERFRDEIKIREPGQDSKNPELIMDFYESLKSSDREKLIQQLTSGARR